MALQGWGLGFRVYGVETTKVQALGGIQVGMEIPAVQMASSGKIWAWGFGLMQPASGIGIGFLVMLHGVYREKN